LEPVGPDLLELLLARLTAASVNGWSETKVSIDDLLLTWREPRSQSLEEQLAALECLEKSQASR